MKGKLRAYKHLYNNKHWRVLRRNQLRIHHLCQYCLAIDIITVATVVDHITPHKGNEELMYNPSNLQSLCKVCHDKVKAIVERKGYLIGTNISGMPADKNSHWYK